MPLSLTQLRERATRHERRKQWSRGYPSHPMIDWDFKLKRSVRAALDTFKRARPFRVQTGNGFVQLVGTLYRDLAVAYDMPVPTVNHRGPWRGDSGASSYTGGNHHITLRGKRSVLTALHEFAHARGYGETGAVWWSVNAFRLTWPKSFAKLRPRAGSHFLTSGETRTVEAAETAWRQFYQQLAEREARAAQEARRQREARQRMQQVRQQARASAQRQERDLAARARQHASALRFPPPNASDWEVANWRRLGLAARQTIFLRRQAEAQQAGRQTPAAGSRDPATARVDPSVERFRRLDLSENTTPTPAADADVGVERIERFRRLQLD